MLKEHGDKTDLIFWLKTHHLIWPKLFKLMDFNGGRMVAVWSLKETTSWNCNGKVIVISKYVTPSARSSKTHLPPNFYTVSL